LIKQTYRKAASSE